MTNIKSNLKTMDIITQIKDDVSQAIKYYIENPCGDEWKCHTRIAFYLYRTLAIVSFKENSCFSDAYQELADKTDYSKLYSYIEICEYINKLMED